MKITKRQLRRIIKEEKMNLIKEQQESSALEWYIQNERQLDKLAWDVSDANISGSDILNILLGKLEDEAGKR